MPGAMTVGVGADRLAVAEEANLVEGVPGLQVGGWQMAVIEAAPGKIGVMEPAPGIVLGVVD